MGETLEPERLDRLPAFKRRLDPNWRGPIWFPVNVLLIESLY